MSQAGIARFTTGTLPPSVPLTFHTDSGDASAVANILNITASTVAADDIPFRFIGSGNTVTGQIQFSQAIVMSNALKVGLSAFNSAHFTVDSNGFVSLLGSDQAIDSIGVDATTGPGVNPVLPDAAGLITVNGAVVSAGTNPLRTVSPALHVYQIQAQLSQASNTSNGTLVGLSSFNSAYFTVDGNGYVGLSGTGVLRTLSDNAGTQVTPLNGNIQLKGQLNEQSGGSFATTVAGTNLIKINPMSPARWIVDPLSTAANPNGTHTTIASALTSATSGDTIVIMPGTYTENLTLKAGVNLVAYGSDSSLNQTGRVIIKGNATFSGTGTVSISGIQLETNGAAFLTVSGSSASVVNLFDCNLNCTDATGISFTSSSASAGINLFSCTGNIGTTGISLFASSSAGTLNIEYNYITNSGSSTTASTISAGTLNSDFSTFAFSLTTSGTAGYASNNARFIPSTNTTAFTSGGSGPHIAVLSTFSSGTATAVTITNTLNLRSCVIGSSNASAISGAGALNYSNLNFIDTSKKISTTTQTGGTIFGGLTQAPSAGFLGEYFINTGTSVNLSTGTATNVASIALTAGIWNISMSCNFLNGGSTTVFKAGISSTSATFLDNNSVDTVVWSIGTAITSGQFNFCLADYRVTLTAASTTYYLVATSTFTTGTSAATGTIRATRVG